MRKEDKIYDEINLLRMEIRKKTEEELQKKSDEAQKEGRYPWEGMWLTPDEIRKMQRMMKKRDRMGFIEVICLLFMVLIMNGIMLIMLLA
jgi:hypothetical protein